MQGSPMDFEVDRRLRRLFDPMLGRLSLLRRDAVAMNRIYAWLLRMMQVGFLGLLALVLLEIRGELSKIVAPLPVRAVVENELDSISTESAARSAAEGQ